MVVSWRRQVADRVSGRALTKSGGAVAHATVDAQAGLQAAVAVETVGTGFVAV